jgi:guanylate kinase
MVTKLNGGSGSSNYASESGVRAEVFQDSARRLENLGRIDSLNKNILLVVGGPTGAGKSTVQSNLSHIVTGISSVQKEHTRPTRQHADPGRTYLSKRKFKRKKGSYLYTYSTRYEDVKGEPETVLYGIPRDAFIAAARKGDAILTLTDPASYEGFFTRSILSQLEPFVNVIPVILTTEAPRDLISRLNSRSCDKKERERRLKQVMPQHEFYKLLSAGQDVHHTLINNSPSELCDILDRSPDKHDIPKEIESLTYKTIDDTVRKLAGIANFYRYLRKNPGLKAEGAKLDIHECYLNWVSTMFFGQKYSEVIAALNAGLNPRLDVAGLVEKIKQDTMNATQVDHIFDHLKLVGHDVSNTGVLRFVFNDVINSGNIEEGKKIFGEVLKDQGYWVKPNTRRFALTDRPSYDERSGLYAIDMILYE